MAETLSILSTGNPCTIYTRQLWRKSSALKTRGYIVVQVWEYDIKQELECDKEIRHYFDNYEIVNPLEPCDAFFGGRTNAAKLYHKCKEGEKIR